MTAGMTLSLRRARDVDAVALSDVFDAAWRDAYQGLIPGVALARYLARRGPAEWRGMIARGRSLTVLEAGGCVVAYAAYGRVRDRTLVAQGEIDELYVLPTYQGAGLGLRLFQAARTDLGDHGLTRLGVWVLAGNARARCFYEGCGGVIVSRALERISGRNLPKVGYAFDPLR